MNHKRARKFSVSIITGSQGLESHSCRKKDISVFISENTPLKGQKQFLFVL